MKNKGEVKQDHDINIEVADIDDLYGLRKLGKNIKFIVISIAVMWSLFQLYTAGFGVFPAMQQRSITLGFAMVLIFFLFPSNFKLIRKISIVNYAVEKTPKWFGVPIFDWIFIMLSVLVTGYIFIFFKEIAYRVGSPNQIDLILGAITILLVLEVTRRTVGWPLVILALTFIVYALFGPYIPGDLAHRGYSLSRIFEQMYITTEGVFGIPMSVMATFVFAFILFGAFLEVGGGSKAFIRLAYALTGSMVGGPAKTAIVGSAMMGTISGSSLANAATTGSFTIPLMKKVGFRPPFAAGAEAAASTGGQIMPPVMGAAVFIMIEFTGLSFVTIIKAAIFPAILYFISVFMMVHFEAKKLDLKVTPKEYLPNLKRAFIGALPLLIPIVGIIYLLVSGVSPLKAAFYATILLIVSTYFSKETRLSPKKIIRALETGAKNAMSVTAAIAACGIISGVVTMTGLGINLAQFIINVANEQLFLTLLMTMVACLVLGMGLPTTATYIVLAPIAVPALMMLDVPLIAAHLFVFYFGILTEVTPPVALTSYVTAGIAQSKGFETALKGFKLSFAGFLVPFMFIYSDTLLLQQPFSLELIIALITAVVGIISLSAALSGYLLNHMNIIEKLIIFIAAIVLIQSSVFTDLIGVTLFLVVVLTQWLKREKDNKKHFETAV